MCVPVCTYHMIRTSNVVFRLIFNDQFPFPLLACFACGVCFAWLSSTQEIIVCGVYISFLFFLLTGLTFNTDDSKQARYLLYHSLEAWVHNTTRQQLPDRPPAKQQAPQTVRQSGMSCFTMTLETESYVRLFFAVILPRFDTSPTG